MFAIFGPFFISIIFLLTSTLQKDIKNKIQRNESNHQWINCGNIPEDFIQGICNAQNRELSSTETYIQESILMKHIVRRAIMADDCCTPECIERFIKNWYCIDVRYKFQTNVPQITETTEKPVGFKKANANTTISVPVKTTSFTASTITTKFTIKSTKAPITVLYKEQTSGLIFPPWKWFSNWF